MGGLCVCIVCALSFVLAGGLRGQMKEGLNNQSQHNTTLNNARQDKTAQYHIFCCVWAVSLVCALYCMLAGGLGAEGGGPIKWCCDKTCRKTKGRTTQNLNLKSQLIFTLTPAPPTHLLAPFTHLPPPPLPPQARQ